MKHVTVSWTDHAMSASRADCVSMGPIGIIKILHSFLAMILFKLVFSEAIQMIRNIEYQMMTFCHIHK